ncbi:hypothetical protein H0H87_011609 [Tephrocybe sp. NHM501043]|nr:hypothetical protein H0H87_011609 [Tephrocybe sp. NHM501043]
MEEDMTLVVRGKGAKCNGKKGATTSTSKGAIKTTNKAPVVKGKARRSPSLYRRTSHPDPKNKIKLYHGSVSDFEFDHSKSTKNGDLHFDKPGFYLTDNPDAAAQYACLSHCLEPTDEATVLEFEWAGSQNVHTFPSITDPTWIAYSKWIEANYMETPGSPKPQFTAMHNMDMLSGPMQTPGDVANGVRSDFWQYVLLNPTAAPKLKKIGSHKVKCSTVVKS